MATSLAQRVPPCNILVLEDSPTVIQWLKSQLDPRIHHMKVVTRLSEAWSAVDQEAYDLVLVDQELPDGTGSQFVRRLRGESAFYQTPILMMTSVAAADLIDEAFAAGVDDFMEKPLSPVEFQTRVSHCMRQKGQIAAAEKDSLTGVGNRHAMESALDSALARATRTGEAVSVLMIDFDSYKAINDAYGHSAGDAVLQSTAKLWLSRLRAYDLVFRYGGDEFVVLLPNTDLARASVVANKLCTLVSESPCEFDGRDIAVTISVGAASWNRAETPKKLLERADQAQYSAKRKGGNQRVACVEGEAR